MPKIKFRFLPVKTSSTIETKESTAKEWDLCHLGERLGYINYHQSGIIDTTYSWRIGVRKVHQGLCKQNTKFAEIKANERLGIPVRQIDFNNIITREDFVDTLTNNFPTYKQALASLAKETSLAVAFNRQFALRKDYIGPLYIEYKGKKIGYSDDGAVWKIHDDYKYLFESLNDIPDLRVA